MPLSSRFPALRHRDFRLLFLGQSVSLAGTHMQRVAVAWQIYQLTHSPWALGLLGLFKIVPVVVFALYGGAVADAVDRRRLMLWMQGILALSSVVLAGTTAFNVVTPAVIYGAVFAAGVATAFENPARQSLVPGLVPEADLPSALSLNNTSWQVGAVLGPALGGMLIAWGGALPVYLLDAISFGAVMLSLMVLHHPPVPTLGAEVSLRAVKEGLAFLRNSPLILSTMALDFVATFFGGAKMLLPVFAEEVLEVGPRGLGMLFASEPLGAAVAAGILASRGGIVREGRVLILAVMAYGASMALFGASSWMPLSLLALALSGAADSVSTIIRQTLRNVLTPDALRGRMTSINMIFFIGGPQLGEVEAGAVARWLGPPAAVISGGILAILAGMGAAVGMPALWNHRRGDARLPDPPQGGP